MLVRSLPGAVLAGLVAFAAQAEEPGAPTVSAQLLIALPADHAIAVEPRDDTRPLPGAAAGGTGH